MPKLKDMTKRQESAAKAWLLTVTVPATPGPAQFRGRHPAIYLKIEGEKRGSSHSRIGNAFVK